MQDKAYRRLFWKIVATTLSFSLVPLLALGFSMYHEFRVSYTAKIMESLRTLTENRSNAIDLFLDERISQLNTLAYTHTYDNLSDETYLNSVFTLMQSRSRSFVDIGIINRNGIHAAYVGPYEVKGLDYSNESWFQEVLLRGVYVSDVFTGFRRFPHFIIAIMRRQENRIWILRATIDTEIFEGMVKAAQVGQRGDAFVVNREGVLQTPPRFGEKLFTMSDYPIASRFGGTRLEEKVIGGEHALVASTWLRNKDWLLVVREDPREELLPLAHARLLVLGLGIGGVLLIVVGTVAVARVMIGQLIKSDREKAYLDATLMQSTKMAALGKLAAGIAHEVNNPLAVIKEKVGWIRDLLSEEDIQESENYTEFEDAVRKIDYHVDRAKKVTHRLLGFARRMEPVNEKVDINRILDETIDFLRNEAHYRNIVINTDFCRNMPQTMSDSSQLQQVFLNILNNAIDAVGKDGLISVTTQYRPSDTEICVIIQDNGPGIPSDVLTRIFDPFFTTKELGSGTGLGLSISYSIVEKLGGRVLVASEVGQGTAFSIYLPLRNGYSV
ncbi:MAG: ATP-binding protein [Syntrophobacteraceae bacterium]|jgi:two-component system NtrC family sensor kinase|nr:ATP-binding protein [Syntrophobacteraceae bacterium]